MWRVGAGVGSDRPQRQLSRRGYPGPLPGLYGVQFHPEVHHTPRGKEILSNFLFRICELKPLWTMASFVEAATESIRQQVGDGQVICALSGGVDSSVTAVLLHRAIGDHLTCIFVNNGVLRKAKPRKWFNSSGNIIT